MRNKLALFALFALLALTTPLVAGCSGSSGGHGGGSVAAGSTAPPTTGTRGTATPGTTNPPSVPPAPPIPTYGTRKCWPIVFVHGIAGFRNIGPINYWMDVPDLLRAQGFEVYVAADRPFATVAERAAQAKAQITARYPDSRVKVNVIAHSMGGLDLRYMITHLGMGDRIASATTIGTPHRGTSCADVIGIVPAPVQDAINAVFMLVGWDMKGAIHDLTTHYVQNVFNPATPDDPRVKYYSWAGVGDPMGTQTGHSMIIPIFWPTWSLVDNLEGENDGLISVKSARWGQFCGTFPADHLNEIGQPLGVTLKAFDYRAFYQKWADELEHAGFGP